MYVFKCCAKPKNRACKSLTHKTRAVLYKRSACKVHTHTHAYQFHVKRVLGPGTKLIPSILSWSQQNDLKTTFLIILSHQIKRTLRLSKNKKRKKKGSPTYPKRLSKSSYLCTTTNSEQLRRIARVTRMPQEPLHFTALVSQDVAQAQRLHSLRQDMEDLHCNRLSSKHLQNDNVQIICKGILCFF